MLSNIENLLRRAEAILKEEEGICKERKTKNLPRERHQLSGYHDSKNKTVDQGCDFVDGNRCKNFHTPISDTGRKYYPYTRIKKANYWHSVLQELYAIEERIFEENRKIMEFHELIQEEIIR